MHAALRLTEVSEVVCEFLDDPTLARLARTCRAFEGPALDALWKFLLGLSPLARLLPDSMWVLEDADPMGFRQYRLTQPLSPEQWNLIRKYASCIMVISSCSLPLFDPSNNRLQGIALHSPSPFEPFPPLFPKLKAIKGAIPGPGYVPLFYWLNGPSMIELQIRWFAGDLASQMLIDFVSNMGTIYPNMKTISLNDLDSIPSHPLVRGLSRTISNWRHLVRVELSTLYLDTVAYEHLMQLESLTSLTLKLSYHCLLRLRQAILPRKPFPMLAELTIVDRGNHIPSIAEWLSCFRLSLPSLSCTTNKPPRDPKQIADLCCAIAAQLCHNSLEMMTLVEDRTSSTSVQVDSIRPLFSFSRLHCVKIGGLSAISLSDDDLLELAASWPLLQDLTLNHYVETQPLAIRLPTFKGFCYLIQNCPRLQKLVIVIDMRDSEWVDVTRPRVRNHILDDLCLGNSLLDDPRRTASILLSVLPSLKQVDTIYWDEYPQYDLLESETQWAMWEEVNHHLGELRKCRESDHDTTRVILHPYCLARC